MGKLLDMFQETGVNVLDLRDELPVNPDVPWNHRGLVRVKGAVIHHTAGWPTASAEALAYYHIEKRGFPGIAYTFYLRYPYSYPPEAEWAFCHRLRDWGPQASGANATTFGIALGGNYKDTEPPAWMVKSLYKLVKVLERFFEEETGNKLEVLPHFALGGTVCPGKVWEAYERIRRDHE